MTAITKLKSWEISDPAASTAIIQTYLERYMKQMPAYFFVIFVLNLKIIYPDDNETNTNIYRLLKSSWTLVYFYVLYFIFLSNIIDVTNIYHIIIIVVNYFVFTIFCLNSTLYYNVTNINMNHLSIYYYFPLFALYNLLYIIKLKIPTTSIAILNNNIMIISVLQKTNALLLILAGLYCWIYKIEEMVYNLYTISYYTLFMINTVIIIYMNIKSYNDVRRWSNNEMKKIWNTIRKEREDTIQVV